MDLTQFFNAVNNTSRSYKICVPLFHFYLPLLTMSCGYVRLAVAKVPYIERRQHPIRGSLLGSISLAIILICTSAVILSGCAPAPRYISEEPILPVQSEDMALEPIEIAGFLSPYIAEERKRYYSFEDLRDNYLAHHANWIIQSRHGQEILQSRHRQYGRACGIFSLAMVTEYLGFAHFTPGANDDWQFDYGSFAGASVNIGYFGSAEHLMAEIYDYETTLDRKRPQEEKLGDYIFNNYSTTSCNRYLKDGYNDEPVPPAYRGSHTTDLYGYCQSPTDRFPSWFNTIGTGCSRCRYDEPRGIFGFLNQRTLVGCNDADSFIVNADNLDDMRRIIKAFIDHNVPLVMTSRAGQHFMVIVGYANLDDLDPPLPRTIIVSNPQLTRDGNYGNAPGGTQPGPRPKFWIFDDLDRLETWTDKGSDVAAYFANVHRIFPWNQHLNSGCEAGGWAAQLDNQLSKVSLCTHPTSLACTPQWFGYQVICLKDGFHRKYHGFTEDMFITEPRNTTCDKIYIAYADGSNREVASTEITSYAYHGRQRRWIEGRTWPHNRRATSDYVAGRATSIWWTSNWPAGNYWTAEGLDAPHTKRRVRLRLNLSDGTSKDIEIAPPQTYGVNVNCLRDGAVHRNYFVEPDRRFFDNKIYIKESRNTTCDDVEMRVSLGSEREISGARITRYRYDVIRKEWSPINSKPADTLTEIDTGLTGKSYDITWNQSWRDNYWWSAEGLALPHTKRKVELTLELMDGTTRSISVVP